MKVLFEFLVERRQAIWLTLATVALSGLFVSALNNEPLFNTGIPPWGDATGWAQLGRVVIMVSYVGLATLTGQTIREGLPIHAPGKKSSQPRRVVVMPVSTSSASMVWSDDSVQIEWWNQKAGKPETRVFERNGIATACTSDVYFNWQQPVRSVRANLPTVERVILVPSKLGWAEKVDGKRPADLQRLIKFLTPKEVEVVFAQNRELDFDNVDEIYAYLHDDVLEGLKAEGFDDSDIVVDATGGTAAASIGAAYAALRSDVRLQYVNNAGVPTQFEHSLRDSN